MHECAKYGATEGAVGADGSMEQSRSIQWEPSVKVINIRTLVYGQVTLEKEVWIPMLVWSGSIRVHR